MALAAKLRGLDEVAMTYVGDGGTSVGDVHEAMNFAGVHKCPVIFVCENNQYAISVTWKHQARRRERLGARGRATASPA